MIKRLIVAIDGPAGSGKSTSAKLVAQRLGYLYIDTGAMYRAVTLEAIRRNVLNNYEAITDISRTINIDLYFKNGSTEVFVNGNDVSEEIRTPLVNDHVSEVSKIGGVRTALVKIQQEMGNKHGGVVMEGRDIGTVVFPNADVKIFLTAAIEQRALRRAKEFNEKGIDVSVDDVKENLKERDKIDSTRSVSPLTKAADAYEVDTSSVTIAEQVEEILGIIKSVANKKGIEISL